MTAFNIHNVRFYDFQPEAIHCLLYNDDNKLLVLSRADGSIELWNCTAKPFKQKTLIGVSGSSVESLVWCGLRLFSSGLNPFILEYDVDSLAVINRVAVTGGPTWCLALSPNRKILAAGTEEGFISLFSVVDDGLQYLKTIQHQKLRILSLGWHSDSEHLVSGSVNFVNLMSIHNDQKTLQFAVSKITPSRDTIVWCVALLDDMTIVTGDSRGKTCFWDGFFGTLISGIQTHQADVLTMQVLSPESVFVAGIDPVIVEVRLIDTGNRQGRRKSWLKSFQRRIHTHDVRTMTLTKEGRLFSGGVDTYLAMSYYPPKTVIKYPATPPRGYVSVSQASPYVALGHKDRVEVWQLGKGRLDPDEEDNRYLTIDENRVKLAQVDLKPTDRLRCVALSPKASRLAFVPAQGRPKVFDIVQNKELGGGSLKKLRHSHLQEVLPSSQLVWLTEDKLLSASSHSNVIQVLRVEGSEILLDGNIELEVGRVAELMSATECGLFVAVLDSQNLVSIFDLKKSSNTKIQTLPKTRVPVTAMALNKDSVFLSYSNNNLSEYDVKSGFLSSWGRELRPSVYPDIARCNNVIANISFDQNRIFIHNVSHIYVIQKESSISDDSGVSRKIPKMERIGDQSPVSSIEESSDSVSSAVKSSSCSGRKISTVQRSNHVLFFSHLRSNELVSVEKNPIWLMDSLPPALKIKKFGAT